MPLTDAELLELEELLRDKEIRMKRERLFKLDDNTNPNYKLLFNSIREQQYDIEGKLIKGYRGAALEGSSRSGKTWSGIYIIFYICLYLEPRGCTINIYRETYNEFKTTLYDDFKRALDDFGLPNPFHNTKEIKSFKIGASTVFFLGDGKHGGGCDYAFYNEVMFIDNGVFDQSEMRCRKFWWADYNPSVTEHWFFDKVLRRPDVAFLRTTYKVNKFISHAERNKILSYEPWKPNSYVVKDNVILCPNSNGELEPLSKVNQPPPHPTNIDNGTADEYMWKVYGLGLRGAMKGIIFPLVEWIDEFPTHVSPIYPNDFGFTTDPNALLKYAEDEHNIWFEPLYYEPVETPEELSLILEANGILTNDIIPCDSSDKYTGENKGTVEMVKGLKKLGYSNAFKISKTKSVMYWLTSMKQKKIHIVKNSLYQYAKKEQENYRLREINGISINQPIDSFNHIWDGARYGHIAFNQKSETYVASDNAIRNLNY